MSDEKWKNVPVIDGRSFSKYEASSLGQVRNKKTGWVFSDLPNSASYIRNEIVDDKREPIKIYAHVIIARTFLEKPESDGLTVDHINRNKADNRLVNLRWATMKQQRKNADNSTRGTKGQPVIQYSMKKIKRWPNITTAAKELKISRSSIGKACRGERNHVGGFKWAYERQNLDGEIWKEYEPFNVQVSNMGRIKPPHCHVVYGSKTGDYLIYGDPGKLVHIMIAETFLPNPENKLEVNHKDKIGTNNKLENLEWVTPSENMIHSHKNNSNPNRYSTSKAVKQYDLEGNFICEYRSINEASRETGCSASGISNICLGRYKRSKGFIFKYSNEDVLNQPSIKYTNKVDLIDEKENVIELTRM